MASQDMYMRVQILYQNMGYFAWTSGSEGEGLFPGTAQRASLGISLGLNPACCRLFSQSERTLLTLRCRVDSTLTVPQGDYDLSAVPVLA